MKPHKWAKEIHAWADGAEIEQRCHAPSIKEIIWSDWEQFDGDWTEEKHWEYRIKPQPKESEFAHIPYWLCCGSLDPHHHKRSCSEAKAGYPERCRFGTIEQHQKLMTQPKEPQYLYVYHQEGKGLEIGYAPHEALNMWKTKIVGKIKLEIDDE